MITHLKFAGVPVRDQERALKFWTETMGFRIVTDQPLGNQRWIELAIRSSETRIVLFTPEGHEDRIGTFFNGSFACDDVEATHRQMVASRYEPAEPARPWWHGLVTGHETGMPARVIGDGQDKQNRALRGGDMHG